MSTATTLNEAPNVADIVAGNVRAQAARLGLTQIALGAALGLTQGQVTRRWKGQSAWQLNELGKVAAVLDVTVVDLVSEPDTQNPRRWIAPRGAAARSKGLEPPTFWSVVRGGTADTPCDVVDLADWRSRRGARAS